MALRTVRAWRGLIRGVLRDTRNDIQSLLNYDNKHPSYQFLTAGQHAELVSAQAICDALLAQTRIR